jgi:hypothetical protein
MLGVAAFLLVIKVIAYASSSDDGLWDRVAMAVVLSALILGLAIYALVAIQRHKAVAKEDKERAALFDSINDFICEKSELELRDTFDVSSIERDGLLLAKQNLTPEARTQADADTIMRDFREGQSSVIYRYMDTSTPYQAKAIPGKLGLLILTRKYIDNVGRLNQYSSSALIPKGVIATLKDFERALSDNNEVLIDAINEGYSISPRAIINAYDCPKDHCSTVNNLFYSRFVNLKPKADAIADAIRRNR